MQEIHPAIYAPDLRRMREIQNARMAPSTYAPGSRIRRRERSTREIQGMSEAPNPKPHLGPITGHIA